MRQIKFRAWNKKEKKMLESDEMYCVGFNGRVWEVLGHEKSFLITMGSELKEANVTLLQFTGLKDKNGKEIYESDLVKVDTQKLEDEQLRRIVKVGIVKWKNAGFFVEVKDEIKDYSLRYPYPSQGIGWEVIGNIYENPELLKKKGING